MRQDGLVSGVAALPEADKRLLKLFFAAALGALGVGVLFGASTALARAGFVDFGPLAGYRAMSGHGVAIFFYWLYFAQAGLLLVLAAAYGAPRAGFAFRPLAAIGIALMAAGFAASLYALYGGMPLLYDAPPELAREPSVAVAAFYSGYLALSAGLFCVAAAAVATTLRPLASGESWSVVSFASVAWAGLLMVTAIAAFTAFGPSLAWALGLGAMPTNYSTAWHVLFHNMHYLPLMATVLLWYVLIETLTGVKSILGARFSKIVFASYLILVPPTSLYHMFLEPDLAEPVRVAGSLLSLFISVPTVLVFLLIVVSLEAHARAQGARGLFGWMRMLPWRNPAMSAIGFAVINLALGGALSFVLIQEKLAPLLSDTFFVPGYFHFLTVGTVTLTFLASLIYVLPALTARPLWRPGILRWLPLLATVGLLLFGTAGVVAGYFGVPRRVLDVSYAGASPGAWETLMAVVGIGGVLMTIALAVYVIVLVLNFVPVARGVATPAGYPEVRWGGNVAADARAWTGPLAIALLVGLMVVFSVGAFELMKALPLEAVGGGAHH